MEVLFYPFFCLSPLFFFPGWFRPFFPSFLPSSVCFWLGLEEEEEEEEEEVLGSTAQHSTAQHGTAQHGKAEQQKRGRRDAQSGQT